MASSNEGDFGASLVRQLLDEGFSYLAVSVETMGLIEEIYVRAGRFFALDESKRTQAILPSDCGYLAFGREYSDNPSRPDRMDSFVASPRVEAPASTLPRQNGGELYPAMMQVFDILERRAEQIAFQVAQSVGKLSSLTHLVGGFRRWSRLEVHRAHRIAQGHLINDPHEDGHLLTFAHATAPGLEIEKQGSFMRPVRKKGAMIVMPGSALTLLTGGSIEPLRHRVVSDGGEAFRFSLLFFADLDPQYCWAWRTSPLNEGVDIGAHVRSNVRRFGVADFAPE